MEQSTPVERGISEICHSNQGRCSIREHDAEMLLKIFPAEIWLQIIRATRFENAPKSLEASNFFDKLLHPFNTQILFGRVLKSLLKYLPQSYRARKSLQTWRMVCHIWKKSVEQIVQDKSHHCNIETEKDENFPKTPRYLDFYVDFPYQFQSLPRVVQFENHFQNTHLSKNKNPFLARYVKVHYSISGKKSSFLPKLEEIFKKCGHHVFYLHLDISLPVDHANISECYQLLRLLPNLKVLIIYTHSDVHFDRCPELESLEVPPFPEFPSEECIKVYGNSPNTEKIFEYAVQTNRHVKSASRMKRVTNGEDLLYAEPMQNLEQIRIGFTNIADVGVLSRANVNWPLRKFVADLTFNNEAQPDENVFLCLNVIGHKFRKTLRELHIFLPVLFQNQGITGMLNLSSLTSLTLDVPFCPYPLDFIMPMKNTLKFLGIRLNNSVLWSEKFLNGKEYKKACELLRSNISELISNVENMSFPNYSIYGNGVLLARNNWKQVCYKQ